MTKTILITGSTDGIGLLTAKKLAADGHTILLHGRNRAKLVAATSEFEGSVETYAADLSDMSDVRKLAADIRVKHDRLDVLINNAGVYKLPHPVLENGLDARFAVNTLAPYLLTQLLLNVIPKEGRVVNLSSAAQAPVDTGALLGQRRLDDMGAYAQSKLGITIWTREWARELPDGPVMIAVNPGSLLASKMVKEGFGVAGKDLNIGADILIRAALDPAFASASGQYFDNDSGAFADPHSAALNAAHSREVMKAIKALVHQHI
ncbi:SDR family NAD(P)-dependent oxidoreductase [Roseibium sp. RKSG952]|uniref:SDR family NAD(P)-dependent oxidoreductase n=1 Tax=Roseibium sp. RKSG952 TaxID=2529384 RepID=UPI0012BD08E0|nr:SDR family NAD(P)-dependent oxidoreductase [Roseibium sp. RKSG952]MTH98207.1 SDR family NAD(P)-dependent oxidoreductase [Roseibium sp. RKSG952]